MSANLHIRVPMQAEVITRQKCLYTTKTSEPIESCIICTDPPYGL